jgi:hypothetical protein
MPGNKDVRIGPIALTTTLTTNVANPPTATGGVNGGSSAQFIEIEQMHFVNKTNATAKVSLWVGATGANAAGTELLSSYSIAAYSTYDFYCMLRLDSADFLVGGCDTATAVTVTLSGTQGVAG